MSNYVLLAEEVVSDHSQPTIFDAPNRHARPPHLELRPDGAVFHGYQEFLLTRDSLCVPPEDPPLRKKRALLAPYFVRRHLEQKTVLDLGANAAFFSFWALQNGAASAVAIDMDEDYLRMVEEARARLGFTNLRTVRTNVIDWGEPADVVVALALIHWIYSCTACLGSLDATIRWLARLTRYMLIVEWIAPEDPAIAYFGHLDWNKESVREPYTLEAFEAALSGYFDQYLSLGHVSPTRTLYVAFCHAEHADASCPLPPLRSGQPVICCRRLAECNGVEYWSRVYDGGDVIYKQATLDLAAREASFLSRLGSDYFPRVLEAHPEGGYSVLKLEKVQGLPLQRAKDDVSADSATLHSFFDHCLNLLRELRAKRVRHRDIKEDNILVRDGKPVLIDFGWAVSDAEPYFTPPGLGDRGRPPDGSFCDVYSFGKVFEWVNGHRYPAFDPVIELMTESDPSLRFTDLGVLKALFAHAASSAASSEEEADSDHGQPTSTARVIGELLRHLAKRNQRLSRDASETWPQQVALAEEELAAVVPFGEAILLVDQAEWGTGDRVAGRRAIPFLERDGEYWGPPPDTETAIREFERLRSSGVNFLAFAWPAFWWLDHYTEFHRHLRSSFRCVLENERLVVFDLRAPAGDGGPHG